MLKGIEKLGGLAGFQKWLAQPRTSLAATSSLSDANWPNSTAITGDFWAALVYEGLDLTTSDGHSGSGKAWGVGIGGFDGVGVLVFSDWNTLLSAENTFYVEAAGDEAGAITVQFTVNGNLEASATFVGEAFGAAVGISGSFNWSAN